MSFLKSASSSCLMPLMVNTVEEKLSLEPFLSLTWQENQNVSFTLLRVHPVCWLGAQLELYHALSPHGQLMSLDLLISS